MTIVLAKLMAITVIKNLSQGIHEVEWHQCDLRKELCAYGGIGSHILSKTDLFLCKSNENQNHFVFLILGYFRGLEMSPVKFWIIMGCCWVPQLRTKPVKNI